MARIISQVLFGLLLTGFGIYLVYFYITGIDAGRSFLLLVPAIILIGIGIFFLLRGANSDATIVPKTSVVVPAKKEESDRLKKNNELIKQWKKTMDQRDRLKLLELQGEEDR